MRTAQPVMTQRCVQRLADLLSGRHHGDGTDDLDNGAQLVVTSRDGSEIFRAPLARHHRHDDDDPQLIWVRPVLGGTPSPEHGGMHVFSLALSRRRALAYTRAQLDENGNVVLTLRSGQSAVIQPAEGPQLAELQRWDDFTLNVLTAEEEHDLDLLQADSWHGRFA